MQKTNAIMYSLEIYILIFKLFLYRLCCLCGVKMEANGLSMCKTCVGLEMKLSDQLDLSHLKIIQCNGCLGYLKDNSKYVRCGLESAELMAICLKSIVKLNRFKLIDAKFVWTEPHSKRIKVKVTIEEETFQSVKVRQSFIAEYKVSYFKCEDCNRQYHNNTWRAVVQLRQKVLHQRTFYHLEQIILQHNAHRMASNIDLVTNGMDVFFMERNHAEKFVHFVSTVAPVKIKASTKLVSTDNHNNTANIKYSHAVEIAPICKFDLVIVPKKIAQHMGQTTSNLLIVSKVTSNLHFVDPFSGQWYVALLDFFYYLSIYIALHSPPTSTGNIHFCPHSPVPIYPTSPSSISKSKMNITDLQKSFVSPILVYLLIQLVFCSCIVNRCQRYEISSKNPFSLSITTRSRSTRLRSHQYQYKHRNSKCRRFYHRQTPLPATKGTFCSLHIYLIGSVVEFEKIEIRRTKIHQTLRHFKTR